MAGEGAKRMGFRGVFGGRGKRWRDLGDGEAEGRREGEKRRKRWREEEEEERRMEEWRGRRGRKKQREMRREGGGRDGKRRGSGGKRAKKEKVEEGKEEEEEEEEEKRKSGRGAKESSHSLSQSVGADATPSGLVSFFGSLVRESINKGYACCLFMSATLLARANPDSSFTLCVIYLFYFYSRKIPQLVFSSRCLGCWCCTAVADARLVSLITTTT